MSGTSIIHARPSAERRIGIAAGFHALKSPTSATREAYGATYTKRTVARPPPSPGSGIVAVRLVKALPPGGNDTAEIPSRNEIV